ncbi:hypothetical protein, partial [Hydrogenophaga sp.]|uniref:hypothetical protein n=1 Tax=Hydrogenophaga sp. TaxID=1904254 RepID=UPI002624F8A2
APGQNSIGTAGQYSIGANIPERLARSLDRSKLRQDTGPPITYFAGAREPPAAPLDLHQHDWQAATASRRAKCFSRAKAERLAQRGASEEFLIVQSLSVQANFWHHSSNYR